MHKYLHKVVLSVHGKIASSWLIFAIDVLIVFVSFLMANVIRFNFDLAAFKWGPVLSYSVIVIVASIVFFLIFKSYASIIRHTSLKDAIKVFQAMTGIALFLLLLSKLDNQFMHFKVFDPPMSILAIFYLNSLFALIFIRILIKLIYHNAFHHEKDKNVNILIYGAGELGRITKDTLLSKGSVRYKIIGFVDRNTSKVGKTLDGYKIYSPDAIDKVFVESKHLDEIIFSIQNINSKIKQEIVDELIKLDIIIKTVPPVEHWISGQLKITQIEKLRIEDLLQRDPIKLNNPDIIEAIKGKTVLVSGGAGSIGSEIVRQLIKYHPAKILVVDNAETPIFELRQELFNKYKTQQDILNFIIADVTDKNKISQIFTQYTPSIVYHAAAYKHVPLMEDHPEEALKVNVMGTKIMADVAIKFNAERFVMVSTDKAVRPTNVMGASKRLAEMYCQSLGQSKKIRTKFVTTRFGNVLGSNGSVVKIFRKQISEGGPVTVTHPEITRYFMTIPEACQLVIEAGIMGTGSDIFVFDMGAPVKVVDLAKKMIKLAGFEPGKEIEIVFTGLRPGEKLYEELLSHSENTIETYHPKIMIAKVDHILNGSVSFMINELHEALVDYDQYRLVSLLKKAIPEYVSNNSRFQKLDQITAESA